MGIVSWLLGRDDEPTHIALQYHPPAEREALENAYNTASAAEDRRAERSLFGRRSERRVMSETRRMLRGNGIK